MPKKKAKKQNKKKYKKTKKQKPGQKTQITYEMNLDRMYGNYYNYKMAFLQRALFENSDSIVSTNVTQLQQLQASMICFDTANTMKTNKFVKNNNNHHIVSMLEGKGLRFFVFLFACLFFVYLSVYVCVCVCVCKSKCMHVCVSLRIQQIVTQNSLFLKIN